MFTILSLHRQCLLITALVFTALAAQAQPLNTVRFTPFALSAQLGLYTLPAPGGGWWLGGTASFRNDSSQFHLTRLGADLQVTRTRQVRVAWRLSSYSHVLATGSAVFFNGSSIGGGVGFPEGPYVHCLDTATLATRWGGRFTNAELTTLMAARGADTLEIYMTRRPVSSFFTNLVRAWTDAATGTRWRGREIPFPQNQSPRVDGLLTEGRRGVQYAYGKNFINGGGDVTFLMKLDTTKVYWERQIDVIGDDSELDYVGPAANGTLYALFSMQIYTPAVLPDETILARFDTAGNLLGSRRITATGRYIRLASMAELPNGDVVLAGRWRQGPGSTRHPFLVRLNSAGNVVWARRWNLGTSAGGAGATLLRRADGRYYLSLTDGSIAELDANFNACQFVDEPVGAVVTSAGTLTVTPQTLPMTPFVPVLVADPLQNRSLTLSRSVVCTAVGVSEEKTVAETALAAWPQPLPRGEALRVALPAGWHPTETYFTLRSGLGQVVWRGPWAEAVTLPTTLPPGVWTLTAESRAGRLHRRVVLL